MKLYRPRRTGVMSEKPNVTPISKQTRHELPVGAAVRQLKTAVSEKLLKEHLTVSEIVVLNNRITLLNSVLDIFNSFMLKMLQISFIFFKKKAKFQLTQLWRFYPYQF